MSNTRKQKEKLFMMFSQGKVAMKVTQGKEKNLIVIWYNESTATLSDYLQTAFNRKRIASNIESLTEPIARKNFNKICLARQIAVQMQR